jgi:hypothetical protein
MEPRKLRVAGALFESSTILAWAGLLGGKCVSAAPDVEIAPAAGSANCGDPDPADDGIVRSGAPNDIPAVLRKFSETLEAAA